MRDLPQTNYFFILVPRSGAKTIQKALEQSKKTGQFLVKVLKFCSEYPEEEGHQSSRIKAALQQNVYNRDLSQGHYVKLTFGKVGGGEQVKISHDELAIHDYGPCHNFDMDVHGPESVRDRTISRQAKLIKSFLEKIMP